MKIKSVSVKEVEYTAYQLAKEFMTWDEPLPDFGTRFPNALESCLKVPFQTYARKHLYRGLTGKAAILFYLMIKNHPFENGNKRIAVMTLLLFLHKNGKWLKIGSKDLYEFAKFVAASSPRMKAAHVNVTEQLIREHLKELRVD